MKNAISLSLSLALAACAASGDDYSLEPGCAGADGTNLCATPAERAHAALCKQEQADHADACCLLEIDCLPSGAAAPASCPERTVCEHTTALPGR